MNIIPCLYTITTMEIKQLEIFVAVAKHKSFSKAARELFLTQPTISSHVQNLENELQTVLLNRNNKTISLTDSGEILYNHAIVILNDCKKALYDIKEYSGKISGNINIVCSSVPEATIFPVFLKKFCERYPNITFTINHSNSNLVVPEILSERATFGIVGSMPNHPHIDSYDFENDELVLICPKGYNIDNDCGFVDMEELKEHNFIMRKEGSGTRNAIINALKNSSIQENNLKIRAYVESNSAVLEMVKSGLGCSITSLISAKELIDVGLLDFYRIKEIELNRKFYLVFSKKKIFTPTEKKFIEYFNNHYNLHIETPNI